MPSSPSWLDRSLWPVVGLLAATLLVFQFTGADIALQDHLFDFETGRWLVDREAAAPTFWFHKFPKYLIIAFAVMLLAWMFLVPRCRKLAHIPRAPLRQVWVVLLSLGLTPAVIGIAKKVTKVHCPWDIRRYGGKEPYVPTWSSYEPSDPPTGCGQCWPAGHASGGFALVSLASLAMTRRGRIRGILIGLAVGGIMGGYQMLKGAHYLSDTLVTMLVAWLIHLIMRRLILRTGAARDPSGA